MSAPKLTKDAAKIAVEAVNAALSDGYRRHGKPSARAEAARRLDMQRPTLDGQLRSAKHHHKLEPDWSREHKLKTPDTETPAQRITQLESEVALRDKVIRDLQAEEMTRAAVRRHLFDLKDYNPKPPKWMVRGRKAGHGVSGVPILFASDWQYGERIAASEINHFNEFDMQIANGRVRLLIEKAIMLLFGEFVDPDYPGIIFALGGDMVSGDSLHDDLTQTNEKRVMPVFLELLDLTIWCIDRLLEHFRHVHVPIVPGNHGRTSRKPPSKERAVTNWDWLLGVMLERHYALLEKHGVIEKGRVTFQVEDSPDVYFQVYDRRYCMTHGDQFRGGDGIIGPLGPVTRGRMKKQARDIVMRQPWDTLMVGHFHTLIQLHHLIINGSLPGYSEFAYLNNMPPEQPAQALWIQHPDEGITHQMPIYLDKKPKGSADAWLKFKVA